MKACQPLPMQPSKLWVWSILAKERGRHAVRSSIQWSPPLCYAMKLDFPPGRAVSLTSPSALLQEKRRTKNV